MPAQSLSQAIENNFFKVVWVFMFVLEWLGTGFQHFFLRIWFGMKFKCCLFCELSIFIFRGMVWNKITKFRVFFYSLKWLRMEFELFFLSYAKVILSCFIFCSTARNWILSILLLQTNGIMTEWIKISVCSMFSGIFFFSENWNPTWKTGLSTVK
jgi:hypothetical protein